MNRPLFSIITPTCRRPMLLQRAIRSVINQTFQDFELIVVDDACDPETAKIVGVFRDDRIIMIRHGQNKGAAAAYNTGIKASRGKFISVLDDDDEFYPEFLEKTNAFFQSAPSRIGFIWTGIINIKDTPHGEVLRDERIWPSDFDQREQGYIEATTIGNGFGMTMRRTCIDTVGLYNEGFQVCNDTEYLFRLAKSYEFSTIPEVLVKIHHYERGQLTHHDRDRLRADLHLRVLKENADFISPYPELFYIHSQRIAELYYNAGVKPPGRKTILMIWKRMPYRISILMDLICYESFGINAVKYWRQKSKTRKLLSRIKKMIRHF
jgi:glycosyltransferase involved in cell wall biosynthesis